MTSSIIIRCIAFLLFLILFAFAWLQVNDPDPVLWTLYYLICAAVPLLIVLKRYSRATFWVSMLLSVVVMGIYAAGTLEYLQHAAQEPLMQSMNPSKPYIEEAREFIGGFIAAVILLLCHFLWKMHNKSAA